MVYPGTQFKVVLPFKANKVITVRKQICLIIDMLSSQSSSYYRIQPDAHNVHSKKEKREGEKEGERERRPGMRKMVEGDVEREGERERERKRAREREKVEKPGLDGGCHFEGWMRRKTVKELSFH